MLRESLHSADAGGAMRKLYGVPPVSCARTQQYFIDQAKSCRHLGTFETANVPPVS